MLSLSTAFNISRHKSWQKLLDEVRSLGFDCVELNVEIPEDWMPEIEASVARGDIRVSSLHNYCPRVVPPEGRTIYSGYLMTSDDADERERAVEYTRRTIEWAGRLKARAVVVHAGEVRTEPSGREFLRYLQQFGRQGKLYHQYYDALMRDRAKKAPHYVDLLKGFLDQVLPVAGDNGVSLGLENRFHPHEIPNIEEACRLLDHYAGAPVGYWHDTGHAEVFVRQGWVRDHADYLQPLAKRLVGMHLHDLRGLADHYAPGSGDFDFSRLLPYLHEGLLLVVEAHAKSKPKEVQNSIDYLKKTGLVK